MQHILVVYVIASFADDKGAQSHYYICALTTKIPCACDGMLSPTLRSR